MSVQAIWPSSAIARIFSSLPLDIICSSKKRLDNIVIFTIRVSLVPKIKMDSSNHSNTWEELVVYFYI